jgi:uncharacterized membrane protein
MNHLTIATSSGIVWLMLICHFGAALIALVAGTIALSVAKGGRLHRRSGLVFTCALVATGLLAAAISVYEGKSAAGGAFAAYLVFTAATTIKPVPGAGRGLDVALMILAFTLAAVNYADGVVVWQQPGHMVAGVPAGMVFFVATICLLAALGDFRMIRAGGLQGIRRLTRHLWRMCFGLFIATGSFFLGQMQFVPAPIRVVPLLLFLAIAPLVLLLYWVWRVRLRRRLSGLIFAEPRSIP